MANYNKVILIGNLTRDPQLSYLPSQTPVVEIGLAVNRKWRGQDNQMKEEVCFIDCTAFSKQAETINQYLRKGQPILIEGHLKYDTWEGKDGVKRSKHRVVVERFQFLGAGPGGQGGQRPAPRPAAQAGPPNGASAGVPRGVPEEPPPPDMDEAPPPAPEEEPPAGSGGGSDIPF